MIIAIDCSSSSNRKSEVTLHLANIFIAFGMLDSKIWKRIIQTCLTFLQCYQEIKEIIEVGVEKNSKRNDALS